MRTLYDIIHVTPHQKPDDVRKATRWNTFMRDFSRKGSHANQEPTLEDVAAHVLRDEETRRVYDGLVNEENLGTITTFIANAKTKIKDGWIDGPNHKGTKWMLFYGFPAGVAFGVAVHPDFGIGIINYPESMYEFFDVCSVGGDVVSRLANLVYSFFAGTVAGYASGFIYGKKEAKIEAEQLTLPPEQYQQVQAKQKSTKSNIKEWLIAAGIMALGLFAGHNVERAHYDKIICQSKAGYATSAPGSIKTIQKQTQESQELPLLEVKISDILSQQAVGYKPNPSAYAKVPNK